MIINISKLKKSINWNIYNKFIVAPWLDINCKEGWVVEYIILKRTKNRKNKKQEEHLWNRLQVEVAVSKYAGLVWRLKKKSAKFKLVSFEFQDLKHLQSNNYKKYNKNIKLTIIILWKQFSLVKIILIFVRASQVCFGIDT